VSKPTTYNFEVLDVSVVTASLNPVENGTPGLEVALWKIHSLLKLELVADLGAEEVDTFAREGRVQIVIGTSS
jgi:hypothetical protein